MKRLAYQLSRQLHLLRPGSYVRTVRPFLIPARGVATVPNTQLSLLIADSLLPKCGSCGVLLQNEDLDKKGYFLDVKTTKKANNFVKGEDVIHLRLLRTMSDEDKMLLLNGASMGVPDVQSELAKKKKQKTEVKIQCTRCRDALFRSNFVPDQYEVESVAQVMETIPLDANLVYVVSAMDFPMSINEDVFKYRSASSMRFVVTKLDLFFDNKATAAKHGQFFQDYLWRKYKVAPENVFCVSGAIDWHTEKLYLGLQDNLYFIGGVNSGKSTLILALVHVAARLRQGLPNAKRDRKAHKMDDMAISQGKPATRQALAKHNLAAIKSFKKLHGPGTSYMPGFTRGNLPFELSRNVTIYDVPGFSSGASAQLYEFMDPAAIKSIQKGQKMHKKGTYKSHYETAKSGQVVTVGGLFFLQVPQGAMLQVRNVINHEMHIFKDLDKALDVWKHPHANPALRDVYAVDATKTTLVKYIIPSFYGSIDLVIRSVGYITLTPTGKFTSNQPFTVLLPEGLEAIIRQPITRYITRTLAGRDAQGNVLRKENWKEKSVTEVKRYTGRNPFLSRLIPGEGARDDAKVMHKYVELAKGAAMAHESISEATQYANWV